MKNSYTAHIKTQMQTTKQQVMSLLHWDEKQYADHQYRMGTQYLQSYIANDPAGIDMLVSSRLFWNWWKNEWLFRDTAFINSNIAKVNPAMAIRLYLDMHNADALIYEIYPNSVVLNDSYADMIGHLIKSEI